MTLSSNSAGFVSAVRSYREAPIYRVMVRNERADADECVSQHLSRTDAYAKAQNISRPGCTAWVVERSGYRG